MLASRCHASQLLSTGYYLLATSCLFISYLLLVANYFVAFPDFERGPACVFGDFPGNPENHRFLIKILSKSIDFERRDVIRECREIPGQFRGGLGGPGAKK